MFTLPVELREKIVTTPWIKHLNLYVCKKWYQFIYNNLPNADLERYIRTIDYFSIKYIRLNFRYKLRELDNVRAAVDINDSDILNMIIKELYDYATYKHGGILHANTIEQLWIIRENVIRNSNYLSLKYLLKLYKWHNAALYDYNRIIKQTFCEDAKILNIILEKIDKISKYFAALDIEFLLSTLSDTYQQFRLTYDIYIEHYFGIKEEDYCEDQKLAEKDRVIKYAYFECIRQGFYNIIKNVDIIKSQTKSQSYEKLLFPLALSGNSKIKYVKQYVDYDDNLTCEIVEKMQIYDRYNKILSI